MGQTSKRQARLSTKGGSRRNGRLKSGKDCKTYGRIGGMAGTGTSIGAQHNVSIT